MRLHGVTAARETLDAVSSRSVQSAGDVFGESARSAFKRTGVATDRLAGIKLAKDSAAYSRGVATVNLSHVMRD
jgi:hypothetical protein